PGNRRWVQLVFDSFLLMANSANSMVDARDALLAADQIRSGGANQGLLWNAFAKRGLGEKASSNGAGDANPTPGFTSPFADEATIPFRPVDETGQIVPGARLFVGDYQARAVAPELTIRSFDIPETTATHLRLEVLTSQCTGAPDYAGEQDADPRANTDCATASPQAGNVRVAEFQAFAR